MSLSLVGHESIRKHPLNHSTAKEVHVFSKSKRFPPLNPECPNAFYTNDSQLSHRKTSFGFGKKSDFTKTLAISPPASTYQQRDFLEESKLKGKSFGTSRQLLPDRSYMIPQIHKNPGPGSYEGEKIKYQNVSYTLHTRPVNINEKKLSYKQSPGPGAYSQYNLQTVNGRHKVAKFSDSLYSIINSNSPRFAKISESPGPAAYKEADNLNGEGIYSLSHRKSDGKRVFERTARFRDGLWKANNTPGPGQYQELSQFGQYGNSNYYKTLDTK